MSSRLGGAKLPSMQRQRQSIAELQDRVRHLQSQGYELLQADESLFSVDGYNHSVHWSPVGQPIMKATRWGSAKPIVVFGCISPTRGVVHWHLGESSFNSADIGEALEEIRVKSGNAPLALMWDNAKIHRSKHVQQLMGNPEIDIEPIWNVCARPDLASLGIERTWARAKHLYRLEVD